MDIITHLRTASEREDRTVTISQPKLQTNAIFNGAFGRDIPVAVPGFRGLEPKLSLNYGSNRSARRYGYSRGLTGVGWWISGLSFVERATRGRGTPNFDAGDIFLLDGEEMVACETGTVSPSCDHGGTHATRVESYNRIAFNSAANTWTVTTPDGTAYAYRSAGNGQTGNLAADFRWVLDTATDTNGNVVQYSYDCSTLPECYPSTVAYNGVTVTFHWETRPDPVSYATGASVSTVDQRLKSIDINVNGSRLRAYKLAYEQGTATGISRLTSIQMFGTDATVDGSGNITGGTSLPEDLFSYSDTAGLPFRTETWWSGGPIYEGRPARVVADMNNDGKDDIAVFDVTQDCGGSGDAYISTGTSFSLQPWPLDCTGAVTWKKPPGGLFKKWDKRGWTPNWLTGDFNDDGFLDFVLQGEIPGGVTDASITTFLSNGSTFTESITTTVWEQPGGLTWGAFKGLAQVMADVNGDGSNDLVVFNKHDETAKVFSYDTATHSDGKPVAFGRTPSDGTAWTISGALPWSNFWTRVNDKGIGDFNGDGKMDLWFSYHSGGSQQAVYLLIAGDQSFEAFGPYAPPSLYNTIGGSISAADFNGDGRTDLYSDYNNNNKLHVFTKDGLIEQSWSTTDPTASTKHIGDYNGDGRADMLVYLIDNTSGAKIHLSTGTGFNTVTTSLAQNFPGTGDFNGDGLTDLLHSNYGPYGTLTPTGVVHINDGVFPDLMTEHTNPYGGKVTASYISSSAWPNKNLRFKVQTVDSLTFDDGRGTAGTTAYAYSGGLWNAVERRFMGFEMATATLPCIAGETQCPQVETTFAQDVASRGRPLSIKQKDGAGTVLRESADVYAVNDTTAPFTSLNTETTTTHHDG
ncbi:MAG: hypothetical protein GY933_13300 [Hyphomicrobiales bacterium]|nr:hypothetical protein [Hyphomicrobiales bacterium]